VTPSDVPRNMSRKEHWVIRDATVADYPVVLSMNNAAAPHVNALAQHEFDWLTKRAAYFRALEDAGGLAGFVLCLPSGLDYWSANYTWFTERYASFLYLDRVVVAPRARGSGVGSALYADLHAFSAGQWPRITLEVNLRPPNPASVGFHEKLGYVAVGTRDYDEGEKAVRMYERVVD
jgi:predicted GNAT superfamily acetyltransferase